MVKGSKKPPTYKKCKSCGKEVTRPTHGYCHNCYMYFWVNGYDTWYPSQYGSLSRVNDEKHPQYGMPICHICGKAYTKLQQHIWYAHSLSKIAYCEKFGLDRSVNMTTPTYHNKMRQYAYDNNMDEQLRVAGANTRFKSGHTLRYERSEQTKNRLKTHGIHIGKVYGRQKSNNT